MSLSNTSNETSIGLISNNPDRLSKPQTLQLPSSYRPLDQQGRLHYQETLTFTTDESDKSSPSRRFRRAIKTINFWFYFFNIFLWVCYLFNMIRAAFALIGLPNDNELVAVDENQSPSAGSLWFAIGLNIFLLNAHGVGIVGNHTKSIPLLRIHLACLPLLVLWFLRNAYVLFDIGHRYETVIDMVLMLIYITLIAFTVNILDKIQRENAQREMELRMLLTGFNQ